MRIGALLLLLASLCGTVFAQVPTPIRSVSSLPTTCNGGSATGETDMVALITGTAGFLDFCQASNNWAPVRPPMGIYASDYGVVGEGHFSPNIAVASEPTEIVTCSDCNFQTTATVGQIFFASTLQNVGGASGTSSHHGVEYHHRLDRLEHADPRLRQHHH